MLLTVENITPYFQNRKLFCPKHPLFHSFKDMQNFVILPPYFVVFRTLMRTQSLVE